MNLQVVKDYLRVDGSENDSIITTLISAADASLSLQTKKTDYDYTTDKLASLYICESVKSLYFSDHDNYEILKQLLALLIDKADGIV